MSDPMEIPASMLPGNDSRSVTAEAFRLAEGMGIKIGQVWRAVDLRNAKPPEMEIQDFTAKFRYGLGVSMYGGAYPAVRMRRLKDGGIVIALLSRLNGKRGGYERLREAATPSAEKEDNNEC